MKICPRCGSKQINHDFHARKYECGTVEYPKAISGNPDVCKLIKTLRDQVQELQFHDGRLGEAHKTDRSPQDAWMHLLKTYGMHDIPEEYKWIEDLVEGYKCLVAIEALCRHCQCSVSHKEGCRCTDEL